MLKASPGVSIFNRIMRNTNLAVKRTTSKRHREDALVVNGVYPDTWTKTGSYL